MYAIKQVPNIYFRKMITMFFLGTVFFLSLFFSNGITVNADQLAKTNENNLLSTGGKSQPIVDSEGNPVSSTNDYYIRAVVYKLPNNLYYFENHRSLYYKWLYFTPTKDKAQRYTLEDSSPRREDAYYIKNVTDNKYLKGYRHNIWHPKGGVYNEKKENADQWYLQRHELSGGLIGYEIVMSVAQPMFLAFDPNTSSVINDNSAEYNFCLVFEKA
ncbi:hypothetical protein ACSFB8_01660 [Enterococcus faecalis]